MAENLEIDCKDCNATFTLKHNLNVARYEIGFCPFCGAEDIDIEDDYYDDDDGEDYFWHKYSQVEYLWVTRILGYTMV